MKIKYFEINFEGINVKCKIYSPDPSNIKNVIISCHGYGGSKENKASQKLAESLSYDNKNFALITFDWPCHGTDIKQKLDLEECDKYFEAVIRYVSETFLPNRLILNATSFGGYLSLKYIAYHGNPFDSIVYRCPAINMYDVLRHRILNEEDMHELNKGKNILSGFDRKMKITPKFIEDLKNNPIEDIDFSMISDKTLIMHGNNDETVSYDVVKNFSRRNNIDFITIDGADHMFKNPTKLKEAIDYSREYIEDCISENKIL